MKRSSLFAAALALAGAFAAPAHAAPTSGFAVAPSSDPAIEKAAYRRCWHHRGKTVCRYYRNYGYAPYYDDGYYGGPAFGLYFGGGGWGGGRGHGGGHHGGHHR